MPKNRYSKSKIITQVGNLQNRLNQLEKNVQFVTVIKSPLRDKLILMANDLYSGIYQLENRLAYEIEKKDYVANNKKKDKGLGSKCTLNVNKKN